MKAVSSGKIPEQAFELTEKMTPSEVAELYQSEVRTFEKLLKEQRRTHFLFRSLLLSLIVNFVAIGWLVLILTG